jgi:ABC-type methionine transport system ATPase subunit
MKVARAICHRVGVMEKGRIVETISISSEQTQPQSEFGKFLFSGGSGI